MYNIIAYSHMNNITNDEHMLIYINIFYIIYI